MGTSDNRHGRWHPKQWREDHDDAQRDPSLVLPLVAAAAAVIVVVVEWLVWWRQ